MRIRHALSALILCLTFVAPVRACDDFADDYTTDPVYDELHGD